MRSRDNFLLAEIELDYGGIKTKDEAEDFYQSWKLVLLALAYDHWSWLSNEYHRVALQRQEEYLKSIDRENDRYERAKEILDSYASPDEILLALQAVDLILTTLMKMEN